MLFNRRDLKSAPEETLRGRQNGSQAKFDKETIARAHRRPNWVLYYSAQAKSGRAQDTQACLGSALACSPLAQIKAAVAHVHRLKQN